MLIFNRLLDVVMGVVLVFLSLADYQTYKIPSWTTTLIGLLGLLKMLLNPSARMEGLLGFFSVSLFLCLLYVVTEGRGIGGGDVKLMAVSGLMLGWQKNILAFFVGCVLVLCVYLVRKLLAAAAFKNRRTKAACWPERLRRIAFAPYLSVGIFASMIWGDGLILAYMSWPGLTF